jgi:signal transduction histidine kinase
MKQAIHGKPGWSRLSVKLFISFLCMAAITIGLLWLIQAGLMRDSSLNGRIAAVKGGVESAIAAGGADWEALRDDLNVNLVFFDQAGNLQSSSLGMSMQGMIVRTCRAMIPDQADGTARLLDRASGSSRLAVIGFTLPEGGYLFAVFSLADLDESAKLLRDQLWLITAILLLAALVLSAVLSRLFATPIRAVTRAARRLAAGRYDVALPVGSRDEIGELTEALNELCVQLQITDNLRKELIANVSHELRAPLAVIRGYAETVRDVTWPDEFKRTEQLGIVADEAARLSRIVGDILDYSRLQAGAEKISLADLAVCPALEEATRRLELESARRSITLRLECDAARIRFDPDRFSQVMDNLLGNALNHADAGSAVVVRAYPHNGMIRIEVANQGDTIPPEELGQIWDRYHRATGEQAVRPLGSGLGLAIVRSILERHRATFGVTSEARTTLFWFDAQLAGQP